MDGSPLRYLRQDDGYRYSMANCLYEALVERILENCDCIPFFVTVDIGSNSTMCRGRLNLYCMQRFTRNFGNDRMEFEGQRIDMTMATDDKEKMNLP